MSMNVGEGYAVEAGVKLRWTSGSLLGRFVQNPPNVPLPGPGRPRFGPVLAGCMKGPFCGWVKFPSHVGS